MLARPLLIIVTSLALATGCSSNSQPAAQNALPFITGAPSRNSPGKYIKHVIVIIQENRSFENFFAGYPGANAPMYGYSLKNHARRASHAAPDDV